MLTQGDYFKIINVNSQQCLAIGSSSKTVGANAIQWTCINTSPGQVWQVRLPYIINHNSGLFLTIPRTGGGSIASHGAVAVQASGISQTSDTTGTAGREQQWGLDGDDHVINLLSGQYLCNGSSSTTPGANAIQWPLTGANGQRWTFQAWDITTNSPA